MICGFPFVQAYPSKRRPDQYRPLRNASNFLSRLENHSVNEIEGTSLSKQIMIVYHIFGGPDSGYLSKLFAYQNVKRVGSPDTCGL